MAKTRTATNAPITYNRVTYWPSFTAARAYTATRPEMDNCRIIPFVRGWAIQRERSGPYWNIVTNQFC